MTDHDAFSDALRSMRVRGTLLFRETYRPPWALSIPDANRVAALLGAPKNTSAVAFHWVERGQFDLDLDPIGKTTIATGELAICFGGGPHRMQEGRRCRVVPFEDLLQPAPPSPPPPSTPSGTRIVCGVFFLEDVHLNPLFSSLPHLVHVSVDGLGSSPKLRSVAELLAWELDHRSPGSAYVVERLVELLCAEAVRAHMHHLDTGHVGWFRALQDPAVGRAIERVHATPGHDWSVARLAAIVAISPSRFATRFRTAMGESPMTYVARWRMNVAGRLIDQADLSMAEVATQVGYDNAAAFSRAFKKITGMPPAAWRERRHIAVESLSTPG